MDANRTFISVVLDRSGSMASTQKDTIGGFNTFVAAQKAVPGKADLFLVLFDHEYNILYDMVPLDQVEDLTVATYVPRGGTALLDAIGRTLMDLRARIAALPEDERPGKVIVAIITDGEENSSKEFNHPQVLAMLNACQQAPDSWEVVYFGANQDAIQVGASYGVKAANAVHYVADAEGTQRSYGDLSLRVTRSRTCMFPDGIGGSDKKEEGTF